MRHPMMQAEKRKVMGQHILPQGRDGHYKNSLVNSEKHLHAQIARANAREREKHSRRKSPDRKPLMALGVT